MTTEYLGQCSIDSCPNNATRNTAHGLLCDTHRKRLLPSRAGGVDLLAPIQQRLEPKERLREIALEYAQAEDDAAFAKAERDLDASALAARARNILAKLHKAAADYGGEVHRRQTNESIAQALARAKAAGRPVGRPRKISFEMAVHAVRECGDSVAKAAKQMGVSELTVRRALKRFGERKSFEPHAESPPGHSDSEES